jgi:hypothetical protein
MKSRIPEALGFGTGLFLSEIYPVLNVNGLSAYHSSGVAASPLLSSLVGILLGAAVFFATIALPKTERWKIPRVALLGLLGLPLVLANRLPFSYIGRRLYERLNSHAPRQAYFYPTSPWKVTLLYLIVLLVFVLLVRRDPKLFRPFAAVGRIGLLTLGILGCIAILNIARAISAHRHDHDFVAMHVRTPEQEDAHPRLVWIIFDELSENQLYAHRAAGLELPNFDALAAQSDVYSDVQPEGYMTDRVIPSLLIGQRIDMVRYTFGKGAQFHLEKTNVTRSFNPSQSLPGMAQAQGWNVGIAGWWNPYCMLMAGYLQSCKWTWREDWADRQMRAQAPITTNLELWARGVVKNQPGAVVLRTRLDENHHLEEWAKELIGNDAMDFVFIHLSPPHGPYPYDRHMGKESAQPGGSYLDGLAEADYELGPILRTLETSPRWANTTLVINGDHSFRAPTYKFEGIWTPEDERISSGAVIDPRPALIVHNPGQTTAKVIAEPTPLMHAHDLMQALIQSDSANSPGGAH